jgi:hypothetical protein
MQERNGNMLMLAKQLFTEWNCQISGKLLPLLSFKRDGELTDTQKVPYILQLDVFLEGGQAGSQLSDVRALHAMVLPLVLCCGADMYDAAIQIAECATQSAKSALPYQRHGI